MVTTRVVVTTENAASTLHLRAEAIDLATQQLETVQYQMAHGTQEPLGITTASETSGAQQFNIATDTELLPGGAVSSTLCTAPPGATSSQIYSVTVTASWPGAVDAGGDRVVEKTLVAPSQAELAQKQLGEIAIPVYGYSSGSTSSLETSTPINVTVTGSCTGSVCSSDPSPASPAVTTETENTGTTGCAVFPDLFAAAGWSYTAQVENNPGWVDPNELSDASTASGVPTIADIAVQANSVTQVTVGAPTMAQGATVTVGFTDAVSGGPGAAVELPITVANVDACPTTGSAAGYCVLGNGLTAFASADSSAQQALLFPFQASSADNYQVWSGDQADSNPQATAPNGGPAYYPASTASASIDATAGASLSVSVPVYPLDLNVSGALSGTVLTATDAGGGDTITLNALSSGASDTGMPLGQFKLAATSGGSPLTLSETYVWVTPTGDCASTSLMTQPCSSPASSISVTA